LRVFEQILKSEGKNISQHYLHLLIDVLYGLFSELIYISLPFILFLLILEASFHFIQGFGKVALMSFEAFYVGDDVMAELIEATV
jgi:hypothetical protein